MRMKRADNEHGQEPGGSCEERSWTPTWTLWSPLLQLKRPIGRTVPLSSRRAKIEFMGGVLGRALAFPANPDQGMRPAGLVRT